jgi:hypothetical protein
MPQQCHSHQKGGGGVMNDGGCASANSGRNQDTVGQKFQGTLSSAHTSVRFDIAISLLRRRSKVFFFFFLGFHRAGRGARTGEN